MVVRRAGRYHALRSALVVEVNHLMTLEVLDSGNVQRALEACHEAKALGCEGIVEPIRHIFLDHWKRADRCSSRVAGAEVDLLFKED